MPRKVTQKPLGAGSAHKSRTGVVAIIVRYTWGNVKFRHLDDPQFRCMTLTRGQFAATYPLPGAIVPDRRA